MQVKWSKQAGRELDIILVYTKERFGEKIAVQFFERVKKHTHRLSQNPYLGFSEPLLKERHQNYRSLIFHKHFKIVYFIDYDKDTIFIADIWDTRREPVNLAKRIKKST